ncbi:hypothetical protein AS156_19005 [Bradyrhizobium macuxiense]|uniref:Uncharacterized protein n=1 Tax=Bradyrhizobium macuxiense TaxID=1755647 RepID=A0A109JGL2_9BRAD|nr:hypothetical protein [Bradyrhizobium macuxiense]KWV48551.1 hypothetical protein AS156_19005 [Bradyrhizobium macuxiense]
MVWIKKPSLGEFQFGPAAAEPRARRVRSGGETKLNGEFIFIIEALVGIAELKTEDRIVRFCDPDIGLINGRGLINPTCRRSSRLNLERPPP